MFSWHQRFAHIARIAFLTITTQKVEGRSCQASNVMAISLVGPSLTKDRNYVLTLLGVSASSLACVPACFA